MRTFIWSLAGFLLVPALAWGAVVSLWHYRTPAFDTRSEAKAFFNTCLAQVEQRNAEVFFDGKYVVWYPDVVSDDFCRQSTYPKECRPLRCDDNVSVE